jgi:hypothetical protein
MSWMAEQWIVRVQGREYGPVDLDELRAWKREGRLIRENEIREADSERWIRAGELPEIFADEPAALEAAPVFVRRLGLGEIFALSWRIYRQGFKRFLGLALLVSAPSFFLQIAAPFLELPNDKSHLTTVVVSAVIAFVILVLLIIAWPFSVAGLQLLASELYAGRNPTLREVLLRAKPLWTRIFSLGLIVYGSYVLWTVIPLFVAFSLATGEASLSGVLLTLLLLVFAAYMVARLFINFLFWQQAGVLGGLDPLEAVRESKTLARSGTDRPRLQRPLYRGALIASLWLLAIIVLNLAIELPVALWRMRGVTSLDQALTTLQAITTTNSPDLLSGLTTFLSCLVHAVFRPWLAAIFVVLYFDTKAGEQKSG